MKNSVEKVNANIKDKRLTKIFLQGCTWTTKHNIVKMYLCNRCCRSDGHTEMNYKTKWRIILKRYAFENHQVLIIIIIVTFLSVNLISYHRPSSTSCQQGTGTVSPKRIFHHNFFAVFGFPQAAVSLIFDGWLQLPLPIPWGHQSRSQMIHPLEDHAVLFQIQSFH